MTSHNWFMYLYKSNPVNINDDGFEVGDVVFLSPVKDSKWWYSHCEWCCCQSLDSGDTWGPFYWRGAIVSLWMKRYMRPLLLTWRYCQSVDVGDTWSPFTDVALLLVCEWGDTWGPFYWHGPIVSLWMSEIHEAPFFWHGLTSTPPWISNYIQYKVLDDTVRVHISKLQR